MQPEYAIDQLCRTLAVTRSGYHAWAGRTPGPRAQANAALLPLIEAAHQESRQTYGAPQVLLEHVQLANYNRQLINWKLDDKTYENFVLSPVITGNADEQLNWRRPLWGEFYPRIRHESSPEDAAKIVLKHLH